MPPPSFLFTNLLPPPTGAHLTSSSLIWFVPTTLPPDTSPSEKPPNSVTSRPFSWSLQLLQTTTNQGMEPMPPTSRNSSFPVSLFSYCSSETKMHRSIKEKPRFLVVYQSETGVTCTAQDDIMLMSSQDMHNPRSSLLRFQFLLVFAIWSPILLFSCNTVALV